MIDIWELSTEFGHHTYMLKLKICEFLRENQHVFKLIVKETKDFLTF